MTTVQGLAHVWDTTVGQIESISTRNSIGRILLREMRQIMCPYVRKPSTQTFNLFSVLNSDYVRNKLKPYAIDRQKIYAIKWLRQYMCDYYGYDCRLLIAKQWVEYVWGEGVMPVVPDIYLTKQDPPIPF